MACNPNSAPAGCSATVLAAPASPVLSGKMAATEEDEPLHWDENRDSWASSSIDGPLVTDESGSERQGWDEGSDGWSVADCGTAVATEDHTLDSAIAGSFKGFGLGGDGMKAERSWDGSPDGWSIANGSLSTTSVREEHEAVDEGESPECWSTIDDTVDSTNICEPGALFMVSNDGWDESPDGWLVADQGTGDVSEVVALRSCEVIESEESPYGWSLIDEGYVTDDAFEAPVEAPPKAAPSAGPTEAMASLVPFGSSATEFVVLSNHGPLLLYAGMTAVNVVTMPMPTPVAFDWPQHAAVWEQAGSSVGDESRISRGGARLNPRRRKQQRLRAGHTRTVATH